MNNDYEQCIQAGQGSGRGWLSGALPNVGESLTALEPEEAYRQAFEAGMVVHRAHPLNCPTSIPALIGGAVMLNQRFYVRNHFQIPRFDAASWRLNVVGLVERPLSLSACELVFRGADSSKLDESSQPIRFERSLSMENVQASGVLLLRSDW